QRFNITNEDRQQLLESIAAARKSPKDTWPDNRFTILDGEQKLLLKNLQLLVNAKADELEISSAILCSRKEIEQLILLYTDKQKTQEPVKRAKLNIVQGWRLRCIGQHLIDTIKDTGGKC
ncbi:MAG: hypothetical protein KAJ32_06530, partial [Gammaproteobacteria bacterium]|nr:hypothetical protein [Gammaproteobacteria bacterium]